MATVIHTADTHLGYHQYHKDDRTTDFIHAFRQVIDTAIEDEVDAVVHAGDLFHDSRPNPGAILNAIDLLKRLNTNDIPFLLVIGNHEDTHESQWADIFETMGLATRLGTSPVTIDNTAFYGLDYVSKTQRSQLDYQFDDHDAEYAALVAHGGFQPLSMHDDWNAEHVLGDSNQAFDALLLGDDHTPKSELVSDVLATYPGSTERTSHDQRADRRFNKVTFGGFSDGVNLEECFLDTREFIYIDEPELDENDTERLIYDAIDNHDITDAVVIIKLDGEGDPFTTGDLEQYAHDNGAFYCDCRDARSLKADDVDVEISFSDPDKAVNERLRDLNLSKVGLEIDTTVRDLEGVVQSNMAQEMKKTMDDKVEDNPDEFTTPADLPGTDDEPTSTDSADSDPPEAADTTDADTTPTEDTESESETDTDSEPPEETPSSQATTAPTKDGNTTSDGDDAGDNAVTDSALTDY